MRARDILKDRVTLVLERNRYRKALRRIVALKDRGGTYRNGEPETDPPELEDAVHVAETALKKVTP